MKIVDQFKNLSNTLIKKISFRNKSTFLNVGITLILFISIGVISFGATVSRDYFSRAFNGGRYTCNETNSFELGEKVSSTNTSELEKDMTEKQENVKKGGRGSKLTERKESFQKLMRKNPEKALKYILPQEEKDNLNSETESCIEKDVIVEGELRISYADYKDGPILYHELVTKDDRYLIHPANKDKLKFTTGQKVRVKGQKIGNEILLDANKKDSVETKQEDPSKKVLPISQKNHRGTKQMVVGLVNFTDRAVPLALSQATEIVLNRTRHFYMEASYYRMDMSGSGHGPYNIGIGATCDVGEISRRFISSVDPSVNFNNVNSLAMFINAPGCAPGLGYVGEPSWTTQEGNKIFGTYYVNVTGAPQNEGDMDWLSEVSEHEFGHNLSAGHANFLNCGGVSIADSGCTNEGYNDHGSIMGFYGEHHTALHKERFGWLDPGEIVTPTSGNYNITPLATAGGLKALKIPRGNGDFLYVHYRQPVGYDAQITGAGNVFDGAQIAIYYNTGATESLLVDPSPPADRLSTAIPVGSTFTDPKSGASITVLGKISSYITVNVNVPPTTGNIVGRIFIDQNGNGVYDTNEKLIEEPGTGCADPATLPLAGFSVELLGPSSFNQVYKLTNCNTAPWYFASNLVTGNYNVFLNTPSGWTATGAPQNAPNWTLTGFDAVSGNLTAGQTKDIWFGVKPPTVELDVQVFNDLNSNGRLDSGEALNSASNPAFSSTVATITENSDDNPATGQRNITSLIPANGIYIQHRNVGKYYQFRAQPSTNWVVTSYSANRAHGSCPASTSCSYNQGWTQVLTLQSGQPAAFYLGVKYIPPDSIAPTVSLTAPTTGSFVSGTSVVVTATATDNTGGSGVNRVEFYLDGAASPSSSDTSSPYSWSWNTTTVTNGNHTIVAKAIDNAENSTNSTATTLKVDNSAPTVSLTAPAANTKLIGTTNITATATDNSGGSGINRVEFLVDGVVKCTDTTSSYSCSWNTITATDGIHSITIKAYDNQNNSSTSTAVSVTVDNTAPNVSITAPASGATVSGNSVNINATSTDVTSTVSKVEFLIDGSLYCTDSASPYSCSWNSTLSSDGAHTITATAYDTLGNTRSVSINVTTSNDTTPPTVSVTAPTSGANISGTTTVTASASDNIGVIKVEFYSGTTKLGEDLTSPYSYSWNTTLTTNGSKSVSAKAYDSANNIGTSPLVNVTVDNSMPTASISTPVANAFLKGTVVYSANASDNNSVTQVQFLVDGSVVNSDTSSPYSYSWNTTAVTNANHSLTVKAYDAAGNITTSNAINVTVDNTAPNVSITSPASGSTVTGAVILDAAATDNTGVTNVEFLVDGVVKGTDPTDPYRYSWDTTTYTNGSHTLIANAYDAAGNVKVSTAINVTVSNTIPDTQAPTIPSNLVATAVSHSQVNLSWTVSTDNVGVVGYNIFRNSTKIATSVTNSFGDSTVVASTNYSYTVSAYDAVPNTSTLSSPSTVTTPAQADTQNPSVSISSPANNSTVSGMVNVSATASDNVGVTKVEFYLNGNLVATDTIAPYSYSWNTISESNNSHQISAKAFDAANNSTISSIITVTVTNGNANPDINGDTKVNVLDLSVILSKWGATSSSGDLNRDSIVDIVDLSILLSNWSP